MGSIRDKKIQVENLVTAPLMEKHIIQKTTQSVKTNTDSAVEHVEHSQKENTMPKKLLVNYNDA